MKKLYPFRGFGVPTVYLVMAMLCYIAFAILSLYLTAETITSIRGESVSHPGEKTMGAIICIAILGVITMKFFNVFQATKGIPKSLKKLGSNLESGLTLNDVRKSFKLENNMESRASGIYYIPTNTFLWPWYWLLQGDTASNYDGKKMRRTIPVKIDESMNITLKTSIVNGQEISFLGAQETVLIKEQEASRNMTGVTIFSKKSWL
jgi:hypothetical protein